MSLNDPLRLTVGELTDSRQSILPAVFLSTLLIRFGFGLILSVYAFYLGSQVETTGLAAAASPAVEASTVVFAGIAADRYGRLPVLRFGLISGAILLLLMSTTRDAIDQTMLSAAFGLTSASILAASLAVTGDVSAMSQRGKEMGYFDAVNLGGWVFGFAAGYILVSLVNGEKHGGNLYVAFWVGAAAVTLALIVLTILSRGYAETHGEKAFDRQELKEAMLRPQVLLTVLPWMAIYMLIGALLTFLGEAGVTNKIQPWELGIAVAVGGSLLLFTQPLYGRLSDRMGRTRVMLIGVIGFIGVLVFGSLIAVYGLNYPIPAIPLVGGIVVSAAAALAFSPASLAALTDASKRVRRGVTMSFYSLSIAAGMAIGILLSSILFTQFAERGVVLFLGIVGVLLVTFTLLRYRLLRRYGLNDLPPLLDDPHP